ncbi:type I restriction-modification system subunit M N-terminal domain-containing protein [Endozoicomonas ascidiicola]|uniref:type I restriction-modification system subunit M N-terminal domain-containing protein n=1 Tax=Endozoicomonas ascidiicola TaxID=1698521 RepID=UPI0024807C7B|nr:type I restriction-modification system subunit M N-terminal domain-containing protein [Endozoicomonas ascidiicola]
MTVIEQITYLLFARMLDMHESKDEQRKMLTGRDFTPRFASHEKDYRFSHFSNLSADEMMELVRGEVFRHFRILSNQ